MQYILLIYGNEAELARRSPAETQATLGEYFAVNADLREKKQYVAAERLEPASTATTVRVRDGKTLRTDGPFAETREQLGGFYMIEAKNLDEAVAIAARIPGARSGCVEVRPISVIPGK